MLKLNCDFQPPLPSVNSVHTEYICAMCDVTFFKRINTPNKEEKIVINILTESIALTFKLNNIIIEHRESCHEFFEN